MATNTEYLLLELRCASLRACLLQSNFDAIGLALKAGLISPDEAVEHLADCGVLRLVGLREERGQLHEPDEQKLAERGAGLSRQPQT
jgi:hypothetical protein